MLEVFSKKRELQIKQKIELCESFISKDIDVEFYTAEKERYLEELKRLKHKRKVMITILSVIAFILVFTFLFLLIYYILSQLL
ncbi:hypothetical protein DRJ48_01945 [Candidatus Woesearchaeota archaeon]|nr:hypothetical protein [Candidatus Woesearchaeota archaeon]RLE43072.1 MAG: hypothetical protein DRJ48_01945 [Candidatus Woesearchaeota archaeon]